MCILCNIADILQSPHLTLLSFLFSIHCMWVFPHLNDLHILIFHSFLIWTLMAVFSIPLCASQNADSQALPTTLKPSTSMGQTSDHAKENTPPCPPPSQGWQRNPMWIGMCYASNHSLTFNPFISQGNATKGS